MIFSLLKLMAVQRSPCLIGSANSSPTPPNATLFAARSSTSWVISVSSVLSEAEEDRIIATFNAKQVVENFSVVVGYADIAAKNYSLSAGQYFDVKIEYSDLTPAQFAEKLQGFTDRLDMLFNESARLEREIKKQLAGLKHAE